MANEIFISYSKENIAFAQKLDAAFRNLRIDPWINLEDVDQKSDRLEQINRGVENANYFLFVISTDSLKDKECIYEAELAIKLKKKLIPIFYEGNSRELFGIIEDKIPALGQINAIYFNKPEVDFEEAFNEVLQTIRGDYFMANEVFISYSRRDLAFVKIMDAFLRNNHIDPWVDWEDIPPGSDWKKKIFTGIENAHTFIFNISPHSMSSQVCAEELSHAVKNSKRIIPVLVSEITEKLPDTFPKSHVISFTNQNKWDESFVKLQEAFDKNLDYIRFHTKLQHKAIVDWAQKGKHPDFLLRGRDLTEATRWLKQSKEKTNQPTELQKEYIKTSQQFHDAEKKKTYGAQVYEANKLIENEEYQKAETLLLDAIKIYADQLEPWQELCYLYVENNEFDKAIEAGEKALEIDEFDFRTLNNLGFSYWLIEEYDNAIDLFFDALYETEDIADIEIVEAYIIEAAEITEPEDDEYYQELLTEIDELKEEYLEEEEEE